MPLICTPGPNILLTASQGISSGRTAAMKAVVGILLGYVAHAVLAAFGVATLIAAGPLLYGMLKWAGVAYLFYLAIMMLKRAFTNTSGLQISELPDPISLWRGFLTSFLNPFGLLMYFAVLPQFIKPGKGAAVQALLLSTIFIATCALVYSLVGWLACKANSNGFADSQRKKLEAIAGVLLAGAAMKIAASH